MKYQKKPLKIPSYLERDSEERVRSQKRLKNRKEVSLRELKQEDFRYSERDI